MLSPSSANDETKGRMEISPNGPATASRSEVRDVKQRQDCHKVDDEGLQAVFIDKDKSLPTIHVDIEVDDNIDIDVEPEDKISHNYLHPCSAKSPDARSTTSRSSGISSALSFVSVASTQISERIDLDASKATCNRSLGLVLAFVSGVLMTAYSSMIKMLDEMDSMQVVVIRGVLQLVLMGSIACYKRLSFTGVREQCVPTVLFLVSLTGGLRLIFIFTSFSRLPLGDSTTIVFSSPVFVMIFSICILKERCGLFRVGAGASLLGGVVLIAKPPIIFGSSDDGEEDTYDLIGYVLVCLACLMSALGIVLTKKISKKVEKTVILFYLGLASAICGVIGLFSVGNPGVPPLWEWGLALAIGLLGLVQQYCLIYAVTLESPSRVTIVRQMQIILAYIVQAVMFHVMPSYTDILGASLVLGTVVTITFEKQISSVSCCCCDRPADKSVQDENDATFKARSVSLSSAEKGGKAEFAETEGLKERSIPNYNSSNTFSHLSDDCDDEPEKN